MSPGTDETDGRQGSSTPTSEITPEVVKGEVRDFLRAHEQRRRQLPRAIVIGVLGGPHGGRVHPHAAGRRRASDPADRARARTSALGILHTGPPRRRRSRNRRLAGASRRPRGFRERHPPSGGGASPYASDARSTHPDRQVPRRHRGHRLGSRTRARGAHHPDGRCHRAARESRLPQHGSRATDVDRRRRRGRSRSGIQRAACGTRVRARGSSARLCAGGLHGDADRRCDGGSPSPAS